ncbi:TIR domain-containing protein [Streptomyces sp. MS1.AVA.3]|uniref:TIR domain-containing protein n=1 Tax=Streptomyces decoyicus TaxID=249567 RepID=UPI0030BE9CF8
MADVFINYRTGDGNETAALIDNELSNRFGKDRAFRASKSIPPGTVYPDALLTSLRRSALLLVVIGADWVNFQSRLRDPEDWVRKEILEAFACGLPVVPVLAGRTTERLKKDDLPADLTRLAELQSVRLDTQNAEADLKRLGDLVAEMVPELHDLEHADAPAPEPGSVSNSAGGIHGNGRTEPGLHWRRQRHRHQEADRPRAFRQRQYLSEFPPRVGRPSLLGRRHDEFRRRPSR